MVQREEEALRTASGWQEKRGAIWTDGPRLDDGKSRGRRRPIRRRPEQELSPIRQAAGWAGRRYHLGRNEVFDAELYMLYQALQTFGDRNEQGRRYTIFSAALTVLPPTGYGQDRGGSHRN